MYKGLKTLNKLKKTRKTQFFHLKKSFVLLFFVFLLSDNGMVAKPLIRILRIHADVRCISKRWFGVFSLGLCFGCERELWFEEARAMFESVGLKLDSLEHKF